MQIEHINPQYVIALGVLVQLAGSLVRHFLHTPRQKAQLDAIEARVELIVGQLARKEGEA